MTEYMHNGYRKIYPIETVLRDMASQEGCDGEPYDAMVFAATVIGNLRAELKEAIAKLPAAQVKVKPLEWVDGDEAGECESGPYDVWCEFGKFQVYFWSVVVGAPHETEGLAKAAAQADHETRIRAALIGGEA